MFFQAARIIKEMRDATNGIFPRITIWENVPGALSSNGGKDFETVLATLDDCGALAQWWYVLDAQFFGVPQRRRRVFVISVFDPAVADRAGDGEILSVGTGRRRNLTKSDATREETASPASRVIGFSHTQGLDPQPSEIATPTLRSNGAGMAVAYDEYNDSINPDIHHAIRAGTKQSTGVISEAVVRRLTPTECERLMGWPDNHTLHRADGKTNSDSTRYKMCGNGVATPVAHWIATQLKEHL
jgi:DNA (cytosine-5)-methyltransferase 1